MSLKIQLKIQITQLCTNWFPLGSKSSAQHPRNPDWKQSQAADIPAVLTAEPMKGPKRWALPTAAAGAPQGLIQGEEQFSPGPEFTLSFQMAEATKGT